MTNNKYIRQNGFIELFAKKTFLLENKVFEIDENNKKNTFGWVIAITLVFFAIFTLNLFTPMTADDFGYLYIHSTNDRIESLSDILHSQSNHYFLWGGRSVVHAIAEGLLLLPPLVIDILNSLAYLLFSFLIYWFITGRKKSSIGLYMLVNLAIWFIQPAFGDTILWITGSANYLWGTAIILLFLLPYRLYENGSTTFSKQITASCLFLPFSILAGWTNENTAGAMLCIASLFLIYYHINKWKIPIWGVIGLAGALIGYLIMILAPGNAVRAGDAGGLSLLLILYRLLNHSATLFTSYGILLIAFAALQILYRQFPNEDNKTSVSISTIFFIGFLIGVYAMVLSPSFPDRAWFGPLTFMIIALGVALLNLDYKQLFLRHLVFSTAAIGIAAFLLSFYVAGKDVYRFHKIYEERLQLVEKCKIDGLKVCTFERYESSTKFVHTEEPLSRYLMGRYYGIDIEFEEKSE